MTALGANSQTRIRVAGSDLQEIKITDLDLQITAVAESATYPVERLSPDFSTRANLNQSKRSPLPGPLPEDPFQAEHHLHASQHSRLLFRFKKRGRSICRDIATVSTTVSFILSFFCSLETLFD